MVIVEKCKDAYRVFLEYYYLFNWFKLLKKLSFHDQETFFADTCFVDKLFLMSWTSNGLRFFTNSKLSQFVYGGCQSASVPVPTHDGCFGDTNNKFGRVNSEIAGTESIQYFFICL